MLYLVYRLVLACERSFTPRGPSELEDFNLEACRNKTTSWKLSKAAKIWLRCWQLCVILYFHCNKCWYTKVLQNTSHRQSLKDDFNLLFQLCGSVFFNVSCSEEEEKLPDIVWNCIRVIELHTFPLRVFYETIQEKKLSPKPCCGQTEGGAVLHTNTLHPGEVTKCFFCVWTPSGRWRSLFEEVVGDLETFLTLGWWWCMKGTPQIWWEGGFDLAEL